MIWHTRCLRAGQLLAVEVQPRTDSSIYSPDELDLLFDELMSNVVEHAGPGSVMIVGGAAADSPNVVVEISDPGSGIDPLLAESAHEFDAPNQTQRGDTKVNLGLALVDRIVQALGGKWGPVDDGRSAIAVTLPISTS